ncbi:MAG: metallophosphoesterase [Verrucomicrobia bacterium]|nr:metallophosphoesterase [Verrucomicrobiota bacterium]
MKTFKILTATDLHCIESLYRELAEAVKLHQPDLVALVGDFLDIAGSEHKQFSQAECTKCLSELPCSNILFTRGNHEDANWWEFAEAWAATGREANALHGESFITGPLVVTAFPCALGDETAFVGIREPLPTEPGDWLSRLLRKHGPAMRTLWLMHEPPTGTPLTEKAGPVSGNPLWNDAIERFSPLLVISGHDHRTPIEEDRWYARLGRTVVVNTGQTDSGPLHYTVIEAEFSRNTPSLPSAMKVTAYPWNKSIPVP